MRQTDKHFEMWLKRYMEKTMQSQSGMLSGKHIISVQQQI